MRRAWSLVLLLLATLSPAHAGGANVPAGGWRSTLLADHPLVGRAWSAATGLTAPEFRLEPEACGFLLLGETHDNPDHHLLQAALVARRCAGAPTAGAVVLEQIRADQQAAVDRFLASPDGKGRGAAAGLLRAIGWEESGWPPAAIYQPLFEAALATGRAILGGEPSRGRVRAVVRGGLSMLSAEERERLALDAPLDARLGSALAAEIMESHCGLLPESAVGGMSIAQRFRDAHLADAMIAAGKAHESVVLIAGGGHVRKDRGVPLQLRRRVPGAKLLTVMLVEVESGKTRPEDYVPRDPDGNAAVDWILFTPRAERNDPCAEMRKQMKGQGGG